MYFILKNQTFFSSHSIMGNCSWYSWRSPCSSKEWGILVRWQSKKYHAILMAGNFKHSLSDASDFEPILWLRCNKRPKVLMVSSLGFVLLTEGFDLKRKKPCKGWNIKNTRYQMTSFMLCTPTFKMRLPEGKSIILGILTKWIKNS